MAYQSLYRRYRSQRFEEVLGQDHVTRALRNAVREGRVAQGYLFSGPRGTGKTSTARILAKVLNCTAPADGEPDASCEHCLAVEQGQPVDWLVELDAASNNGVDAMRDLLSRVAMGTSGNRKVYILDEVHMLSPAASNALLKTLEEPPEHVVFVLATTEPEKVLPTIRSRTQHFEFKLLPADVLADHVRYVIADAGLDLGDEAVEHVVAAGRGSARDTLSALDQVAAAGEVDAVGVPVDDLVDALGARDTGAALLAVDAAVRAGRDPRVLATALIQALREAFLEAMGAPAGGLTDRAAQRAHAVSQALGPASLTRALEAVGAAIVEMRHAPDPRIPLEVAIVGVTRPEASADLDAVVRRLERLEQQLARGVVSPGAPAPSTSDVDATPGPTSDRPRPDRSGTDQPRPEPSGATAAAPSGRPERKGSAAARATLAARQADEAPATTPSDPSPPAARPSLGAVRRARAAGESGAGATEPSTQPQPEAASPAAPNQESASTATGDTAPSADAPAGSTAGDFPSVEALTEAWEDSVRDRLKGRAKALYKLGRFVGVDAPHARFAVPNAAHREQCLGKLEDVQQVLADHFGRPVLLDLVVDGEGATTSRPRTADAAPATGPAAGSGPDADPDADLDIDLDELEDAPDAAAGGIARLQDAFPGAELLEDQ